MKKIISVLILIAIIIGAVWFYMRDQNNFAYTGIPAVDCIDYTKPVQQDFELHITIRISGKVYPLSGNIGHDYGNCLRSIYTDDASGVVKVRSNNSSQYTLGQFFNVWHTVFNSHVLLGHPVRGNGSISVFLNGNLVNTYENTPLLPGENIVVDLEQP